MVAWHSTSRSGGGRSRLGSRSRNGGSRTGHKLTRLVALLFQGKGAIFTVLLLKQGDKSSKILGNSMETEGALEFDTQSAA